MPKKPKPPTVWPSYKDRTKGYKIHQYKGVPKPDKGWRPMTLQDVKLGKRFCFYSKAIHPGPYILIAASINTLKTGRASILLRGVNLAKKKEYAYQDVAGKEAEMFIAELSNRFWVKQE